MSCTPAGHRIRAHPPQPLPLVSPEGTHPNLPHLAEFCSSGWCQRGSGTLHLDPTSFPPGAAGPEAQGSADTPGHTALRGWSQRKRGPRRGQQAGEGALNWLFPAQHRGHTGLPVHLGRTQTSLWPRSPSPPQASPDTASQGALPQAPTTGRAGPGAAVTPTALP